MDRRGWLFAITGVLLGLAAGFAAWGIRSEASEMLAAPPVAVLTPIEAPVAGALAPDFQAEAVDDGVFRLHEVRGRAVLVNFWATWCEPCRAEMPLLQARLADEGASRLLVVGINADDTPTQVSEYREELELTFPLLLDPGGQVQRLYRVRGYPTTFFIDETGLIRSVHVGSMDAETLDGYLKMMGLH